MDKVTRDRPVVDELVAVGISKKDIVLDEKPVDVRPFMGFGVG